MRLIPVEKPVKIKKPKKAPVKKEPETKKPKVRIVPSEKPIPAAPAKKEPEKKKPVEVKKEVFEKKKPPKKEEAFKERIISYFKNKIKHRNKRRRGSKIISELSDEKIIDLIYRECIYCGNYKYSNKTKIRDHTFYYNGIDRIDSSKGYIEGNVVSCCSSCNGIKMDRTLEEFFEILSQDIYNNHWNP